MSTKRILVTTLPPFAGGVPAKARILCRHLRDLGHQVTVAYYATFSADTELLAPSWRIPLGALPSSRSGWCWKDQACVAVGCWLPELEATYYLSSSRWRSLIAAHDRHIAVGGNVLTAYPLVRAKVPHLIWCASGFWADRVDRHLRMPLPMRLLDKVIKRPWLEKLEARVLTSAGQIMCVSEYTRKNLIALGAAPARTERLPIPTEPTVFFPSPQMASAGIVGFAGRINDPRKDIRLLIEAVTIAVRRGGDIRLYLAGEAPNATLNAYVHECKIQDRVRYFGELEYASLPNFYRELDMFIIPSHQEGLCIAGVEALASGLPVISTRCGGPEDYIVDGQNGYLTSRDPNLIADLIINITKDRPLRRQLSQYARQMAVENYSPAAFSDVLAKAWRTTWGETL